MRLSLHGIGHWSLVTGLLRGVRTSYVNKLAVVRMRKRKSGGATVDPVKQIEERSVTNCKPMRASSPRYRLSFVGGRSVGTNDRLQCSRSRSRSDVCMHAYINTTSQSVILL